MGEALISSWAKGSCIQNPLRLRASQMRSIRLPSISTTSHKPFLAHFSTRSRCTLQSYTLDLLSSQNKQGRESRDGAQNSRRPQFWRPLLFATTVSFGAYYVAAYAARSEMESLRRYIPVWWLSSIRTSYKELSDANERKEAASLLWLRQWMEQVGLPEPLKRVTWTARMYWLHWTASQKVCASIIAANTVVFLLWQLPSPVVRIYMRRYFTHHPLSGKSVTLLTSVFSHQALAHFALNMVALYSIGSVAFTALNSLPARQSDGKGTIAFASVPRNTVLDFNPVFHCAAFFVTAGLFASITSHSISVFRSFPRLMGMMASRRLAVQQPPITTPIIASLGASGAIYSTLIISALAHPEASVYLIFLPFIPISIGPAVLGIVALDCVGIIRGWRIFDHWAHLAGAAFGAWYYHYGGLFWTRVKTLEAAIHRRYTS